MNGIPDFLSAMGLRLDADERAVRRAYATELKKIDQQTQVEAFQQLRENYEAALAWIQRKQRVEQSTEHETSPEPAEPEERALPAEDVLGSTPSPSSQENVHDIVAALRRQLEEHPLDSIDTATRVLKDKLEDPRLLDMDARFLFEAHVAHILAGGWQPGHEHLFGGACDVFEWHQDGARLQRLGQAGHIVDNAIVEQHAQAALPPAEHALQLRYLELLRRISHPDEEVVALGLDPVMRAASLFPNWVRLTSKVDNIAAWREVDVNAARSTFLESRSTVSTGPSGTLQPAKLVAWFVIFFVGILLFALLQAFAKWRSTREPVTEPLTVSQATLPSASRPASPRAEIPTLPPRSVTAPPAAHAPQVSTSSATEYILPPRPVYPPISKRLGEQGKVVVKVLADENGAVIDLGIAESSGFERLDAAAIDAARAARIAPVKDKNGNAMPGWYKMPINFALNDTVMQAAPRKWGDMIAAAIKHNIVFVADTPGNPVVEYKLDLAPDGRITNVALSKASGVSEWDAAALRGIIKTDYLPLPPDRSKVPSQMILTLRPKPG